MQQVRKHDTVNTATYGKYGPAGPELRKMCINMFCKACGHRASNILYKMDKKEGLLQHLTHGPGLEQAFFILIHGVCESGNRTPHGEGNIGP